MFNRDDSGTYVRLHRLYVGDDELWQELARLFRQILEPSQTPDNFELGVVMKEVPNDI